MQACFLSLEWVLGLSHATPAIPWPGLRGYSAALQGCLGPALAGTRCQAWTQVLLLAKLGGALGSSLLSAAPLLPAPL